MPSDPLAPLRRAAKRLHKAYDAQEAEALHRLRLHPPRKADASLKRADFLHVIAQENGFESWPKLKLASEINGFDRAGKQQRLKIALYHGQNHVVKALLADTPDLAAGQFGLQCALLNLPAVTKMLAADPSLATRQLGPRRPILHLAFSRYIHARPDLQADMLAIAGLLVAHGADVNDSYPYTAGGQDMLSALYGALGHANNLPLAEWLLSHGADPNDNESLYHSTELGHLDGLRLLLENGAQPKGTNALLRAMDYNNHAMVQLLLDHGADPQESGIIPALHQGARRFCDGEMMGVLISNGAAIDAVWQGRSAYALARIYGNPSYAEALEKAGADSRLSPEDQLLAAAALGQIAAPPLQNPTAATELLGEIIRRPEGLPHAKALVALGADTSAFFDQGLPLLQVAGWEGLPDAFDWALGLNPDLTAVNGYGGDLLSTIMHGSENCPERATRDHQACADMALRAGAVLTPQVISFAGDPEMAEFLESWEVNGND